MKEKQEKFKEKLILEQADAASKQAALALKLK
jgi:hypothetical protein